MEQVQSNSRRSYRIVIIGRPNVGKSTLFNRLIGSRKALVHNLPGVTRDRLEQRVEWWVNGQAISAILTDTGGLLGEQFAAEIEKQVNVALLQADVVLFLFDSQAGLTHTDRDLYRRMRQSGVFKKVPVIAVVNKIDSPSHEERESEFYTLEFQKLVSVSAEHGRGIEDLKETIAGVIGGQGDKTGEEDWKETETETETKTNRIPKIAIVGRPNVGKSTLVNSLLGENRMITSPIAGTTVDAVDSFVHLKGRPFILLDTAGVRRKSKTEKGIEVLSVVRAKAALEQADLAVLVLDGEKGITEQDEKVGGLIEEAGCSVVLMVNKWDTQRRNPRFTTKIAAERIRQQMAYLGYAPLVFASALRKRGLGDLGQLFEEILQQRNLKISTRELTDWVRTEATIHNPKNAKFFLCHQTGRHPPSFVCHVNDPDKIHFSLKRHLINAMRDRWGFMGSPIRLNFTSRASDRSPSK